MTKILPVPRQVWIYSRAVHPLSDRSHNSLKQDNCQFHIYVVDPMCAIQLGDYYLTEGKSIDYTVHQANTDRLVELCLMQIASTTKIVGTTDPAFVDVHQIGKISNQFRASLLKKYKGKNFLLHMDVAYTVADPITYEPILDEQGLMTLTFHEEKSDIQTAKWLEGKHE